MANTQRNYSCESHNLQRHCFLSAITANERKQERQGRYVYQRLCPFLALKLATNMMSAGMSTARSDPRMSMMGLQGLEDPTSLRMKVPDVSSGR